MLTRDPKASHEVFVASVGPTVLESYSNDLVARRLGSVPGALRAGAYAVPTSVWPGLRTAWSGRHLAIVAPLLVTRLAAEPLLRGAGQLELAARAPCDLFSTRTLVLRCGAASCSFGNPIDSIL